MFYKAPKGFKVMFCNSCAQENMIKWDNSRRSGAFTHRKDYNPANILTSVED